MAARARAAEGRTGPLRRASLLSFLLRRRGGETKKTERGNAPRRKTLSPRGLPSPREGHARTPPRTTPALTGACAFAQQKHTLRGRRVPSSCAALSLPSSPHHGVVRPSPPTGRDPDRHLGRPDRAADAVLAAAGAGGQGKEGRERGGAMRRARAKRDTRARVPALLASRDTHACVCGRTQAVRWRREGRVRPVAGAWCALSLSVGISSPAGERIGFASRALTTRAAVASAPFWRGRPVAEV